MKTIMMKIIEAAEENIVRAPMLIETIILILGGI